MSDFGCEDEEAPVPVPVLQSPKLPASLSLSCSLSVRAVLRGGAAPRGLSLSNEQKINLGISISISIRDYCKI